MSTPSGDAVTRIVNEQAEDEGLWFEAPSAPEGYLQAELRRLHAAIEALAHERSAEAAPIDEAVRARAGGDVPLRPQKGAPTMGEPRAEAMPDAEVLDVLERLTGAILSWKSGHQVEALAHDGRAILARRARRLAIEAEDHGRSAGAPHDCVAVEAELMRCEARAGAAPIDGAILEQAIRNLRREQLAKGQTGNLTDGWTIAAEYARLLDAAPSPAAETGGSE